MVLATRPSYQEHAPARASVTRAQDGDPEAFTILVQDHGSDIYNYVLRLAGDPEDAHDIVQDVWTRVARHLGSLQDPDRFRPWLYRIARNCSMDFHSAKKCRPQQAQAGVDEDSPVDGLPDDGSDQPERRVVSLDERRKVWETLGRMSECDRTVLFLRESQEMPYSEIADVLGISRNAAEVRVFRARERFRKQFMEVDDAKSACHISPLHLSAWVDGEVDGDAQTDLRRHIESCDACADRVGAIRTGRGLYRGLAFFVVPNSTVAAVLARLSDLVMGGSATNAALGAAAASTAAASTAAVAVGAGTATTAAGVTAGSAAATAGGGLIGQISVAAAAKIAGVALSASVVTGVTATDVTPAAPPPLQQAATIEVHTPSAEAGPSVVFLAREQTPSPAGAASNHADSEHDEPTAASSAGVPGQAHGEQPMETKSQPDALKVAVRAATGPALDVAIDAARDEIRETVRAQVASVLANSLPTEAAVSAPTTAAVSSPPALGSLDAYITGKLASGLAQGTNAVGGIPASAQAQATASIQPGTAGASAVAASTIDAAKESISHRMADAQSRLDAASATISAAMQSTQSVATSGAQTSSQAATGGSAASAPSPPAFGDAITSAIEAAMSKSFGQ
jgi:RNA polymerase sigma-70 factor (ECF subfamily)